MRFAQAMSSTLFKTKFVPGCSVGDRHRRLWVLRYEVTLCPIIIAFARLPRHEHRESHSSIEHREYPTPQSKCSHRSLIAFCTQRRQRASHSGSVSSVTQITADSCIVSCMHVPVPVSRLNSRVVATLYRFRTKRLLQYTLGSLHVVATVAHILFGLFPPCITRLSIMHTSCGVSRRPRLPWETVIPSSRNSTGFSTPISSSLRSFRVVFARFGAAQ